MRTPTRGRKARWQLAAGSYIHSFDGNDLQEGDVDGAVCLEDNVIHPNRTDRAGSDNAVGTCDPDDLVSILGIEQSIAQSGASSQGDGGRLLFGLEHLRQLKSEQAGNLDEIGVSKRVHRTCNNC